MSKRVKIEDLTKEQCLEHVKRLSNVNFIKAGGNYLEVDVFPMKSDRKSEATVIVLSCEIENLEESSKDFYKFITKITGEVEDKVDFKVITGTTLNKYRHAHFSAYINRKIDTDIEKTWKHGHSNVSQYNTNDHASLIRYVCT